LFKVNGAYRQALPWQEKKVNLKKHFFDSHEFILHQFCWFKVKKVYISSNNNQA